MKWGYLRETADKAKKEGIDKITKICRTGLDDYLKCIFHGKEWIHNKGMRIESWGIIRPDFRCEELNLIVLYG